MRGSNDIDLMVVASLMPTPDGVLMVAALGGEAERLDARSRTEDDDQAFDATGLALLLSGATLVLGLLALLPATL